MDWNSRIRSSFAGKAIPDDDVIEELAQHAAAAYEAELAEGHSPQEAGELIEVQLAAWVTDGTLLRRRALRPPAVMPPAANSSRSVGLIQDVRYALRLMGRQPGHTAAVLATMALGIAAAALLFSVTYGVLLRPLPWPEADRLVRLFETRQNSARRPSLMTNSGYLAWREGHATLEDLGAWSDSLETLTGTGDPERIMVVSATPSLFAVLRARPLLGQLFSGGGSDTADESEALLSHWLWQERFGGRGDIVGRQLVLDGRPYRVVGVMPASFAFPERDSAVWVAFRILPVIDPAHPEVHRLSMFSAIGRLRAGVTADQASSEGTARVRAAPDPGLVGEAVFGVKGPGVVLAMPLLRSLTAEVRPALLVLMAGVGLLLAVATGNVALLQLARSATRAREIAIRAAIGADGRRLVRQMLVECLVIGLAGGALALIIAGWLHRALPEFLPQDFPRLADVALDWRVASFAVMVTLIASTAFGMVPALQARRVDLAGTLAEDGSAPIGGGIRSSTARTRLVIMAGQVAIACVLLIGAVLLLRSFIALAHADRGYDAGNLVTARLLMPATSYTALQRVALLNRIIDRLRGLPAVRHAAAAGSIPLGQGYSLSAFTMTRRDGTSVTIRALQRIVSPDYFAALGIRLLKGRVFTDDDTLTSGSVIVVNRSFAAQYFDSDTVGTKVPLQFNAGRPGATIVGIVDNVSYGSVTDNAEPEYYVSTTQMSGGMLYDQPYLLVRTQDNPARVVPDLRGILKNEDPMLVLESVMTMEDRVSASIARPRLYALLLGGFAAFALAIAGVGLFGTLSYSVAHRSKELAVRSALGATPGHVVRLVLGQALLVIACGAAVGVAAAALLVRLLSTLLYGIGIHDTLTFILVPPAIALTAALACAVPARRAARIDPLRLLK